MERDQIIKSVIAKLEYLRDLPITELETGLDEVEVKIVDLRDRTIERFRREEGNEELRSFLQQINIALSVIFGLEYPVTGFQRNKIKQAIELLKGMVTA